MADRKRGLGRTLETLLSGSAPSGVTTSERIDSKEDLSFMQLAVEKMAPGQYQPRRDIDQDASGHGKAGDGVYHAARFSQVSFSPLLGCGSTIQPHSNRQRHARRQPP